MLSFEDIEDLRVWKFLEDFATEYTEDFVKTRHIKTYPLIKEAWQSKRGLKSFRYYIDDVGTKYIKVSQDYVFENGLRDVKEILPKKIEFYDNKNELIMNFYSKQSYSKEDLDKRNREIRQARIDYLTTSAEDLRQEAELHEGDLKESFISIAENLELLYLWYEVKIKHYIDRGNTEFEKGLSDDYNFQMTSEEIDQVQDEDEKKHYQEKYKIKQILNFISGEPSEIFPDGSTVYSSIYYQLTGVVL